MSEEKEYESLKQEIIEKWSHEELLKLVLRQQKIIERLEQEIEKLKDKQLSNSQTSSKPPTLRADLPFGGFAYGQQVT